VLSVAMHSTPSFFTSLGARSSSIRGNLIGDILSLILSSTLATKLKWPRS